MTEIFKDSISFPVWSTVAMQSEDWGSWTYGVIKEAYSSDHRMWSYIIRVMKMGRLITQNMIDICSTLITIRQYLWEHIKKGYRWLQDIFMQKMSAEQEIICRSFTAYSLAHMIHDNTSNSDEGEKVMMLLPSSDCCSWGLKSSDNKEHFSIGLINYSHSVVIWVSKGHVAHPPKKNVT